MGETVIKGPDYGPILWTVFTTTIGPLIVLGMVLLLVIELAKAGGRATINHLRFGRKVEIDDLSPREFEEYVGYLFTQSGYRTEHVGGMEDFGADLILRKDGVKTVVQVKHWRKPVGMSAVREVLGALGYYKADKALVVCSRTFSRRAVDLAKANRVQLYDADRLRQLAAKSQTTGPHPSQTPPRVE